MTIIARRNKPNFYSNSQKVLSTWTKKAKHHRKIALPFIVPLFWTIVGIANEVKFTKSTAWFFCNGIQFRGRSTKKEILFEDVKNKKIVTTITHIDEIPKAMDTIKNYT